MFFSKNQVACFTSNLYKIANFRNIQITILQNAGDLWNSRMNINRCKWLACCIAKMCKIPCIKSQVERVKIQVFSVRVISLSFFNFKNIFITVYRDTIKWIYPSQDNSFNERNDFFPVFKFLHRELWRNSLDMPHPFPLWQTYQQGL